MRVEEETEWKEMRETERRSQSSQVQAQLEMSQITTEL